MREFAPGIYFDVSNADYHAAPGLSHSGMKDLSISALRFWHRKLNPDREPDAPKPHLDLGSALHCAVLEPASFSERYACAVDATDFDRCLVTVEDIREWMRNNGVTPKGTRKAELVAQCQRVADCPPILDVELENFKTATDGMTIIGKNDWQVLTGMTEALANEESLKPLLREGKPEVSIFVKDPETGVLLKIRLDWFHQNTNKILDIKSFSQMNDKSIDRSVCDAIYNRGYWKQAWFYCYVYHLHFGVMPSFIFAFAESEAPFETRIKELSVKSRYGNANIYWQTAGIEVRRLIDKYADCLERFGNRPWRSPQEIEPLEDEDMRQLAWAA